MAQKKASEIKAYFNTGDKPTESNFIDLIDTCFQKIRLNGNDLELVGTPAMGTEFVASSVSLNTVQYWDEPVGGSGNIEYTAGTVRIGTNGDPIARIANSGFAARTDTVPTENAIVQYLNSSAEHLCFIYYVGSNLNVAGTTTLIPFNTVNYNYYSIWDHTTNFRAGNPFASGIGLYEVTIQYDIVSHTSNDPGDFFIGIRFNGQPAASIIDSQKFFISTGDPNPIPGPVTASALVTIDETTDIFDIVVHCDPAVTVVISGSPDKNLMKIRKLA